MWVDAVTVKMLSMTKNIIPDAKRMKLSANKNAKRVVMEQQAAPSKEQQVATMGYNPYAYWPYYGRA
uniref:Zinc finger protein n=1 Tax=Heterorhabditis bacteriophora TaxID=37862 RepID=A0A1I7WTQ7_HETBA